MDYKQKISAMKEESKLNTVKKAYWLFLQNGIDNVTLADVAKASDITPTTLYRYFGDKKTLLMECGKQFWKETLLLNNPSINPEFNKQTGFEQLEALLNTFYIAYSEYSMHLRFLRDFDIFMMREDVEADTLMSYDDTLLEWCKVGKATFTKGLEDHTIRDDVTFEEFYFTTARLLLTFIQKLASENNVVPSDSLVPPDKQIKMVIKMVLAFIKPQ